MIMRRLFLNAPLAGILFRRRVPALPV